MFEETIITRLPYRVVSVSLPTKDDAPILAPVLLTEDNLVLVHQMVCQARCTAMMQY
jgi:hypothetical protein